MDGQWRKHWYIPVIAVLILSTFLMSQAGISGKAILIPVGAAFLLGFGVLIGASVKQWKKPDEEILAEYTQLAQFFTGGKEIPLPDRKKRFMGALGVAGFALVRTEGSVHSLIFLGLALALFGIPLLLAWKGKPEKKERLVKPEVIVALLLGLLPTGFMCFFIGIGVYHGAWWFVLPPGLCFLSFFSRPLAAAIRTLLDLPRLRRDRGEGHLRQGKEIDPWDRPDRDVSSYIRKK